MRITENDNLKSCVVNHVLVDGFDIYDSPDTSNTEVISCPLMLINVTMSKPKNDLAHIKIYVFKNRSVELDSILAYMQNLNPNVFASIYDMYRLLSDYIHTHINYLDDYAAQYYTIDL